MEDLLKFVLIVVILGGLLALAVNLPDVVASLADIENSKAQIAQAEVSLRALDIARAQMYFTGVMITILLLVILALVILVGAGAVLAVKAYWISQASQVSQLYLPDPGGRRILPPPQEDAYFVTMPCKRSVKVIK